MILRYGSKCKQLIDITYSFLLDVGLFGSLEMKELSLTLITPYGLFLAKLTFFIIPPRRFLVVLLLSLLLD